MADTKTLIEQAYAAFNKRDIDGALALMTHDVSWPKASEGGKVIGKEEIRAYWTRQWGEFDPHVEPLAVTEEDGGRIRVRVHQIVRNLEGNILSDSEVLHIFTMNNGLTAAMDSGMRPIQRARLPHFPIDPDWQFAVEFENGNQSRVCGSTVYTSSVILLFVCRILLQQ